jgi:hypothetical protein
MHGEHEPFPLFSMACTEAHISAIDLHKPTIRTIWSTSVRTSLKILHLKLAVSLTALCNNLPISCVWSRDALQRLKNVIDCWIIGHFSFCHRMCDIKFTFHNSNLLECDWLYFVTHQGCPTSHHWRAALGPPAYLPAGRIIRVRVFLFQYSDTDIGTFALQWSVIWCTRIGFVKFKNINTHFNIS